MQIKKHIFIFTFICFISCINNLNGQQLTVPEFRSLSIDPTTNEVVLKWRIQNASENILVHEISRKPYTSNNYFFNPTATVPMPDTVYRETVPDLETQRQSYRIKSNNDTDASPISDLHLTMQFSGEYNQCKNTMLLRWTTYRRYSIDENGQIDQTNSAAKQFNDAIKYEVWGHHGNTFNIALAEKLSETTDKNTDITIENLLTGTNYFLFVKTLLPNGDTATSHRIEIHTTNKRFPEILNIDTIVSEMGMVNLYLNVDKTTEIDTFAIYRSDNRIPLAWYYSPSEIPAKFTDRTTSIGQVYKYNIVAFVCGQPILKSDTVSNILLYATPLNLNAEIIWTDFFNESYTPEYTLHRTSPSELTLYPGNALYFLDESTHDSVCFGPKRFCYVMTADTEKSHARSEQACVSLNSMITMPEAIDPLSDISVTKNCNCNTGCTNYRRLFGPVMDINNDAYSLEIEIYDRSGIRLFSSKKDFKDLLQKEYHYWNGKYKNQYVKPGVYVYYAKIEFLEGTPTVLRGSVTVVMQNSK
ncbi:MAG: gliding motility-associated C-terminal domain-containing protein [Prevotellaceae bacterium]|jgi:hypothetical protein|nr:gliding motility-associated C-terminal domain-containing protein [Prevotellaceae bacterium]